jgi:hypothetical protein
VGKGNLRARSAGEQPDVSIFRSRESESRSQESRPPAPIVALLSAKAHEPAPAVSQNEKKRPNMRTGQWALLTSPAATDRAKDRRRVSYVGVPVSRSVFGLRAKGCGFEPRRMQRKRRQRRERASTPGTNLIGSGSLQFASREVLPRWHGMM